MCFLFHQWSRWTEPTGGTYSKQSKKCVRCNKVKERYVSF